MQNSKPSRHSTLPILISALFILCAISSWAAGSAITQKMLDSLESEDYYYQEVYDGISVESRRLAQGEFAADILIDGLRRARYEVSAEAREGRWHVFSDRLSGNSEKAETTLLFDYDQAHVDDYEGSMKDFLKMHNVLSVGLSAILLWEDHEANAPPAVIWPFEEVVFDVPELAGLPEEDDYTQCTVCTPAPNGCTAVPDNCPPFSTQSIRESCQEHDSCYQCGAVCFGRSRLQCDRNFRTNVAFQANQICSWIYFLGVRGLGWLFYQTASGGAGIMNDVYSLGLTLSACEGQYEHMCTVYVF